MFEKLAIDSVATSAAAFVVGGLGLYTTYLLFLHPLSGYPGPWLAKLTEWYTGYHAVAKDLHLRIYDHHATYGPIVRIAPNRLVFNTVTALHDIYQNDRVVKSHAYRSAVRNNVDNVFTSLDKALHRSKRRMVGAALTERATKSFEPTVLKQIDVYLRELLSQARESKPVSMTERTRWLALDIVGRLSFGYDLEAQVKEDNRFVSKALAFGLYRGNIWHHVFFLSKLYVDKIFDRIFFESREKYLRLLEKMIKNRLGRGEDGDRDFYSFITELSAADGGDVRKGELWWEANFLIVAGSDTTATAMTATFFYLSRYPECYKKLRDEIRSKFASGQDIISGPQLSTCHYLRACIDEAMRLSPPLPGTLWRTQDPNDKEPLKIDGHFIPQGTLFGVSTYAIHHNEKYFPDPFVFKPERWLEHGVTSADEQQKSAKRMSEAFAVFSIGSRSCAGKALAYMESSLVLAKTLWYFDFEAAEGRLKGIGAGSTNGPPGRRRTDEFQLEDIFTSRHDGPMLVFRPREELCGDFESSV
ncbi:cytochrome P450 [Xylariaceae sp. FL1272]|nr:cytochrome P450 [Xylariaceae sp. FL1272]